MLHTYGYGHYAWPPYIYATSYYRSSWTVYTFWSLYCIYQLLQKTFYCNDNKITEFDMIDTIHPNLFTAGRGESAETCGLDDVFPPDDLCSRPEGLVNNSLSIYIMYPITVYKTVLGMRGLFIECHLLFSLVFSVVYCSIISRLKLWYSHDHWHLFFIYFETMISVLHISHLPGCFRPWTFFQIIGFNMVLLGPCVTSRY